jgi:uncharacterized membrane protein
MKHRLELFSDAILAIIITIMVLDLHTPATGGWKAFIPALPAIGIYAIGFLLLVTFCTINVCIVARVKGITRAMMWFNFASLFLTSLFPLLIRNLAKHPGDRADTLVFLLAAHLTVQALTLFRIAAHKMHYQTPGFMNGTKREIAPSSWHHQAHSLIAHHLVLAIRRFGTLCCDYHLESSRF